MGTEWFLAWWNLIYILPFLLALLYLLIYATSGLTFGEVGADASADVDADADVGVDADAGSDVEASADADADADADAEGGAEAGPQIHGGTAGLGGTAVGAPLEHAGAGAHTLDHTGSHPAGEGGAGQDLPFYIWALSALGVGKVPLSIVLMVLLFSWGGIGFVTNNLIKNVVPMPWLVSLVSLPAASLGSIFFTRGISALVARWLPTTETYVQKRSQLVGTAGEALFDIDGRFGLAAIRDRQGNFLQVPCRTYGDSPLLRKGDRVLLVDYDPEDKIFYVTATNLPARRGGGRLPDPG